MREPPFGSRRILFKKKKRAEEPNFPAARRRSQNTGTQLKLCRSLFWKEMHQSPAGQPAALIALILPRASLFLRCKGGAINHGAPDGFCSSHNAPHGADPRRLNTSSPSRLPRGTNERLKRRTHSRRKEQPRWGWRGRVGGGHCGPRMEVQSRLLDVNTPLPPPPVAVPLYGPERRV